MGNPQQAVGAASRGGARQGLRPSRALPSRLHGEWRHPATRAWLEASFEGPTPVQREGWPRIAEGRHSLLLAPTGSGKTLAAFLYWIDRLARRDGSSEPAGDRSRRGAGVRLLYISPLKALVYDIERNLRSPLAGVARSAGGGLRVPRVAVRTGDTPQRERRAQGREPAEILVTTPESLYLILGSGQRETLRSVEAVIVDEIHALAPTKRGAHLAFSLERVSALVEAAGGGDPQRIGLSATARPVEEVARFLGGDREVAVVDVRTPPALDLRISVPVPDMTRPAEGTPPVASLWPALHPVLLEAIRAHRTSLVFVNSRGLCERLAQRLNELAGEELVRAHHGSVAHARRREIEEELKAGRLRAIVATSSLELGIDMGAVDLVVLVESPGGVARGLQRVGRAAHRVGEVSRALVLPKHRGDLLEATVVAGAMAAGEVEPLRVPRNPLDVLAQQIVAMCAAEPWRVGELERRVRRGSLARLRREVAPVEAEALARFLPGWHGARKWHGARGLAPASPLPDLTGGGARGRDTGGGTGPDAETALEAALEQLEGLPFPFTELEEAILPARVPGYLPRMLDERGALGRWVWIGCGALGGRDGRVALYRRERAPLLASPPEEPAELPELHRAVLAHLDHRGASFAAEIAAALPASLGVGGDPGAPSGAVVGRWSRVAPLLAPGVSPTERAHARALLLLERHGVVSRSAAAVESLPGGFAALYPVLRALEEAGAVRRGHFAEGLAGAQFALPGAVDRLRAARIPPDAPEVHILGSVDPACPFGFLLPWPAPRHAGARPRRAAGARVVSVDGAPVLFLERGARRLWTFPTPEPDAGEGKLARAVAALPAALFAGARRRPVRIDAIDAEPAARSPWAGLFLEAGFRVGYRGLELDRPAALGSRRPPPPGLRPEGRGAGPAAPDAPEPEPGSRTPGRGGAPSA